MEKRKIFNQNTVKLTKNPKGTFSSIFIQVLGWGGMIVASILIAILAIATSMKSALMIFSPMILLSGFGIIKGRIIYNRVGRYHQYVKAIDNKEYIDIKQLAESTKIRESFIVKDLKKMIQIRMLPNSNIDNDNKVLMLTEKVYDEYTRTLELRKIEVQNNKEKQIYKENQQKKLDENPKYKSVIDTINEGKKTVIKIKETNRHIPSDKVSKKLYRLEAILNRIFEYLEENPKEVDDTRKLFKYYLPTIEKMVNVYENILNEPIQGENIINTKKEIEDGLDTINNAFEKILDDFYKETAIDVSTDIKVMETMLSQDGLSKKGTMNI